MNSNDENVYWTCDNIQEKWGDLSTDVNYIFKAPEIYITNLRGCVKNPEGQAISGALVELCPINTMNNKFAESEFFAVTDQDGNYEISNITKDNFPAKIRISKDGYETWESDVITELPASGEIVTNIKMIYEDQPLPPVPEPIPVSNTTASNGGSTPHTGDDVSGALVIFAVLVLVSSGTLIGRKLYLK